MFTYTVTIGRNYGTTARTELQGQPMSDQLWAEFEDKVNELLADYVLSSDADYVEVHRGTGTWDGVSEDSTATTLRTVEPLDPQQVSKIRAYLREFADRYGQDAVALTIGESTLIRNSFTNVVNA